MEGATAAAYASASHFFRATAARVPEGAWEAPGLGRWTVRELVGHANRAHLTVEEYLHHPRPPEPADSPYFSDAAIEERARAAVALLGADPLATLGETAERVLRLVADTPADAPLGTPFGSTTLGGYLPSRTAELVIHGCDLAAALGLAPAPPSDALGEALTFLARRAESSGRGVEVLRALSGRGQLPPDFSLY